MSNYFVYHLHTENSLLDSCTNHRLYTDRAVELGQKAIGFSEHGNIYNWVEKKMYANSKGLKYVHECEIYLTESLYCLLYSSFDTVALAAKSIERKPLNLGHACKTGYKCGGYYWTYMSDYKLKGE